MQDPSLATGCGNAEVKPWIKKEQGPQRRRITANLLHRYKTGPCKHRPIDASNPNLWGSQFFVGGVGSLVGIASKQNVWADENSPAYVPPPPHTPHAIPACLGWQDRASALDVCVFCWRMPRRMGAGVGVLQGTWGCRIRAWDAGAKLFWYSPS